MRIAALYDIHGNLPALEAVLSEVSAAGVDEIVVGGDLLVGPLQVECIEQLRGLSLPVRYIMGNTDREAIAARSGNESKWLPAFALEGIRWSARQLSGDHVAWISTWPKTTTLEMAGLGRVLFCHATPRDDNEIFTARTAEQRLLPIFRSVEADIVVCGHTHMQFDRMIGSTRVLNAGSIGMPFGEPGADWLLLGPGVELRHTNYDLQKAAGRIVATGFPRVPEFDMLKPPPAAKMMELYSQFELQ